MANVVRLARNSGFNGRSTDSSLTRELIAVPWYDPKNYRMPYVYSLHLTVGDAETFIGQTPVRGRELTGLTGNFSRHYALMPDGSNVRPTIPALPIKYHGVAIIDLYKQHDIFETLAHSSPGMVVTEAGNDPWQRLAKEIHRILRSMNGAVRDMRAGENSGSTRWPMPQPS